MFPRLPCLLLASLVMMAAQHAAGVEEPPSPEEEGAIFVPTPLDVVAKMLEVGRVTQADLLYDLGCGDGRIVVAAARNRGCRAIGYDIDERKVRQSRANVQRQGVERLVQIVHQDIFKLDLREATVVTLYLLPEMNVQLLPQLKQLKDGSRIVAHEFPIAGVKHDGRVRIVSNKGGVPRDIYLYTLPLRTK